MPDITSREIIEFTSSRRLASWILANGYRPGNHNPSNLRRRAERIWDATRILGPKVTGIRKLPDQARLQMLEDNVVRASKSPDKKCQRCFRCQRCYSGEFPCNICIQEKYRCRPQGAPREEPIPGIPKAEKCQRCSVSRRRCDGKSPCNICIKEKRPCHQQDYLGLKRQAQCPREDRCHHCFHSGKACDGNTPCRKCIRYKLNCHPRMQKRFSGVSKARICTRCLSKTRACDGKFPCNKCILQNKESGCRQQGVTGKRHPSCISAVPKAEKCKHYLAR